MKTISVPTNLHADPCVICRDNIIAWLHPGDRVIVLDTAISPNGINDIPIAYIHIPERNLDGYIAARCLEAA